MGRQISVLLCGGCAGILHFGVLSRTACIKGEGLENILRESLGNSTEIRFFPFPSKQIFGMGFILGIAAH